MTTLNMTQNMPGPLAYLTASHHDDAALGPPPGSGTAPAPDPFASYVELSLDHPAAVRRLHELVQELRDATHLAAVLPRAVDGATALMDAEFANIQLVDPRDGSLVLVTQHGFGPGFLDHFAVVRDDDSICGRAARQLAQAVAADVQDDPAFAPHREIFRISGVRAVQSTPLIDGAGRMIGMLSTHASEAGLPPKRDLQLMELYSRFAGEAIVRHLNETAAGADPTGSSGLEQTLADARWSRLMTDTVNRLFAAGLSLACARRLITDALTAERVQVGLDTLDEAVQAIQRAMFHGVEQPARLDGGTLLETRRAY